MTAPANDNFAAAATVEIHGAVAYVSAALDNTDATRETDEPFAVTGHGSRTLWWNYTPVASGDATFDTALTGGEWPDTVLAVYTGTALATLVQLGSNDDGYAENYLSELTLAVTAGTTYRVQAGMYSTSETAAIVLRVTGPYTYPPVSHGGITAGLMLAANPALIPVHGVPAALTVTANPAPWTPDTVVVFGESAAVALDAAPGALAIAWTHPTAVLALVAGPTVPAGDAYADAVVLAGASGGAAGTVLGATREAGEPDSVYGEADTGTVWHVLTPGAAATVSFSVTVATGHRAVVEVYEGESLVELELVVAASADPVVTPTSAVTFIASEGVPYYLRVHQHAVDGYSAYAYAFTVTGRDGEFTLTLADATIAQTPATVRVSVTNGTPDAAVTFTLPPDPTGIWTDELDETGILTDVAVPLDAMGAGTYTLVVTEDVSALTDDVEFTVAEDPLSQPTDLPPDTEPVAIPQTGIVHWVIQDPAPAGVSWTFPHNPAEMTSPFPAKNVTVDVTVAEDGQAVTFHGADKPRAWEFRGRLSDQSLHDILAGYAASNRRYYLIDHRSRAWVVTFEHFDAEAEIRPNLPWAHTYTMHCLIYSGPVQL